MRRAFFGRSVLGFGNSGKLCEVPSFAFNFSPSPKVFFFFFSVGLFGFLSFFLSLVFNLGSQLFLFFFLFSGLGISPFFFLLSFFFEIKKIDFMRR